jgi:hypothetical protein
VTAREDETTIPATAVRIGDRLRTRLGDELTVTRIDPQFMGRVEMVAFVEDSDEQWLKMPADADADADVVLVSRASSG